MEAALSNPEATSDLQVPSAIDDWNGHTCHWASSFRTTGSHQLTNPWSHIIKPEEDDNLDF